MFWQHQCRVGHVRALQQYLAIFDTATVLPSVALLRRCPAWYEQSFAHCPFFCSMHRLAGRLFTTFFVGVCSGWGLGSPSFTHLCAWTMRLTASSSRLLQGVDSPQCRWLCGTPACPCRPVVATCASSLFPGFAEAFCFLVSPHIHGLLVYHLVFFFTMSLLFKGHLYCRSESISSAYCWQEWVCKLLHKLWPAVNLIRWLRSVSYLA